MSDPAMASGPRRWLLKSRLILRGRAHKQGRSHNPHRGGSARSASSDHRSIGRTQHLDNRPARLPGRGLRRDRFLPRRCREAEGARQDRNPCAHRNKPGRHPRHARRGRDFDRARRHDQPCCRCGPRHGTPLRLRCERLRINTELGTVSAGANAQGRRPHNHRRIDRPSHSGSGHHA